MVFNQSERTHSIYILILHSFQPITVYVNGYFILFRFVDSCMKLVEQGMDKEEAIENTVSTLYTSKGTTLPVSEMRGSRKYPYPPKFPLEIKLILSTSFFNHAPYATYIVCSSFNFQFSIFISLFYRMILRTLKIHTHSFLIAREGCKIFQLMMANTIDKAARKIYYLSEEPGL